MSRRSKVLVGVLAILVVIGLGIWFTLANTRTRPLKSGSPKKYSISCKTEYQCDLVVGKGAEIVLSDIFTKIRNIKLIGAEDGLNLLGTDDAGYVFIEHGAGDACWRAKALYRINPTNGEISSIDDTFFPCADENGKTPEADLMDNKQYDDKYREVIKKLVNRQPDNIRN